MTESFQAIDPTNWPIDQLKEILNHFKKVPITVLGDVGVDGYTMGSVDRISPEAPVPILAVEEEILKLGLAANVSDNLQTLGAIPLTVGVVGEDRGAEDLRKLFKKSGISSEGLVSDPSRRTVFKERIVSGNQQLLRVDYETLHSISSSIQKKIEAGLKKSLKVSKALIIEDYAKGLLSESLIQNAISLAKKEDLPVLIDPNMKTPLGWYKGAAVMTPNQKEAEALTGISIYDGESLFEAGAILKEKTKAKYIIVTLGKNGMAIFGPRQKPKVIPTYAVEVYDVSGAGDTVISVLALALSSGASVEEAVILSNIAAGVEVGKRGTATVSREEIYDSLEDLSF